MLYLGLDVHSKWMTIKGFDPQVGEIICMDRVSNSPESIRQTFEQMDGPLQGAMESGTNAWAVYRELEPFFEKLLIVDPATVWGKEVRRRAKTDKRDAMKLAIKLQRGELTGLYIPDNETQDQRNLVRAKVQATQRVTKIVNEIGGLLRSWGIIVECSLLSKKGQELIERVKPSLPEHSLLVLDLQLEMLEKAKEVVSKLEEAIDKEAEQDEDCKILLTIPGVGSFTALLVAAEIGDINRFPSCAHLISYCGLSPSVSQSADKVYYGKLSRFCNRFLKYALVLRAQTAGRLEADNPFRKTYWRVAIRQHLNDAKIAVARQMARVIYSMLKKRERFDVAKFIPKTPKQALPEGAR